jgi:DNA-binding transcriptional LysR family regulator
LGKLKSWEDAWEYVFIECDRTLSYLRRLPQKDQVLAKFRHVWFLGSVDLMVKAIEEGLGVGIVPDYLVAQSLVDETLTELPFANCICDDAFRLVMSADLQTAIHIQTLAKIMQQIGVR